MPYQDPKPEEFKAGQKQLSAEELNKLRRGMERQVRGVGDTTVQDYGDRTTIGSRSISVKLPSQNNYIQQFVFIEEYNDYLMCVPRDAVTPIAWDSPYLYAQMQNSDGEIDTTELPIVYVAKPFHLQQTPWLSLGPTGQMILYEAVINAIYFTPGVPNARLVNGYILINGQTSFPLLEDQVITPMYLPGELILAAHTMTGYTTPEKKPEPIMWMDMNTAARAWALDVNQPQASGAQ